MSKTKHTLKPWEAEPVEYQGNVLAWSVNKGPHRLRTEVNREADARLIAAAPELLEALEACVEANRRETMAGRIVVAPGVFAHSGDPLTDEDKRRLDELHFRKIDMADSVLVVNPGGYIGDSTRREIAYAESTGKPVTYTHNAEHQARRDSGVALDAVVRQDRRET
jgi:hypothetical protein